MVRKGDFNELILDDIELVELNRTVARCFSWNEDFLSSETMDGAQDHEFVVGLTCLRGLFLVFAEIFAFNHFADFVHHGSHINILA